MAPTASGRHRELDRYLLDGERLVAAVHQHWGKVAEPIGSAVAAGLLALWVDAKVPASFGVVSTILWWAWFAVVGRALWRLAEWRHDWFVATDKRLLLFYGFITRKVAMMPLSKVTDMTYNRSVMGRILGYGRFVMESAGQDQALSEVNWVPDPDHTYRAICAEIFGVEDHDRMPEGPKDPPDPYAGGPGSRGPEPYAGGPAPADVWEPERPLDGGDAHEDHSRGIPVRRPGGEHDDSLYRSPDLRREREADTGPIPMYPPENWLE